MRPPTRPLPRRWSMWGGAVIVVECFDPPTEQAPEKGLVWTVCECHPLRRAQWRDVRSEGVGIR